MNIQHLSYFVIVLLIAVLLYFAHKGIIIIVQIIKGYGVPNVTTHAKIICVLADELQLDDSSVFFDLGAGDGTVLSHVQELFPTAACTGIEYAPAAYQKAIQKKQASRGTYTLLHQNLFKTDLSNATHIYCYLMPHLMTKLWKKISTECTPGTKLYVNAFPISEVEAVKEIEIERKEKFVKKLWVYEV